jgi:hypothetical protein
MNRLYLLWYVVVALVLLACQQGPPQPEEPVWGKQPCAHCAMLVSRPESAAQYADADGETWFFDDLGCLVSWQTQHPSRPGEQAWVRQGAQWLAVAAARYGGGHTTPMDFGYLAEAGGTLSWQAVQQAVTTRQRSHAQ